MSESEPTVPRGDSQRKCSICNLVFQRTTHLRRHMLTHTQDKRFACSQCGKSFVRRDTLHRHQITHRNASNRPRSGSTDALSARACKACASARVRCSRQSPCERCNSRRLQCIYEDSDRRPETASEPFTEAVTAPNNQEQMSLPQDNTGVMHHDIDSGDSQTHVSVLDAHHPSFLLPAASQSAREQTGVMIDPTWTSEGHASSASYNFQDPGIIAPYIDKDSSSLPATNWLPYTNSMDWDFDFYMSQALNNLSPAMGMHQANMWSPSASILNNNCTNLAGSPGAGSKSSLAEESPAGLSTTNSATSSKRHGTFYVDGEVSRLTRRRNIAENLSTQDQIGSTGSRLEFNSAEAETPVRDTSMLPQVPVQTYDRILEKFRDLCIANNPALCFERFRSDSFPSRRTMEICIESFFNNTNTTFPIVHRPTTSLEKDDDWILCLAMASIGAITSSSASIVSNAEAYRTFLQRAITTQSMLWTRATSPPELSFMQACIIHDILELYLQQSTNEEVLAGTISFSSLCADIKRSQWLSLKELEWNTTWTEDSWRAWAQRESQRRVAYCAWLLDSWDLLTTGKSSSANFSLGDVQTDLPVHEALWAAESPGAWLNLKSTHKQPTGLIPLLRTIYHQEPLAQEPGDFAHTIAILAVCRRTQDVGLQILDPLSGLDAGQQQSGESVRDVYWLPSDPEYQKWRNKALDCLDTLHWATHAVIARLQGLEPPVVLHLHMSRLILLVPYRDVHDLISEVVSSHGNDATFVHAGSSRSRREDFVARIWLWISKDHYKSRLAIVHAGAMFWYIRHHGTGNIFEPTCLYMAIIVLWAYGSFVPLLQTTTDEDHPAALRADAEEEYDPTMIQIDRPCDDELIQIFIRRGNAMQPHMLGVGNICQSGGALGVLKVGAKLIKNRCSAWPISKAYESLLLRCAQASTRTP